MKRVLKKKWWATSLIAIFALGGVAWITGSWWLAVAHTRPRTHVIGPPPADLVHVTEAVTFQTSDGVTLKGWYLNPGEARAVVVLLHGHGYDRYAMLRRARWLIRHGYAALVYDARGHGESDPVRVTVGYKEREDLKAAVKLLAEKGWEEFYAIGFSQGAVAILGAAEALPGLRGAVLESPYDTLEHHAARSFSHRVPGLPARWVGWWYTRFLRARMGLDASHHDPLDDAANLSAPALFVAGGLDPYSPPSDVRLLFDRAPEPRYWLMFDAVGHGDFYAANPGRYTREVAAFLVRCASAP